MAVCGGGKVRRAGLAVLTVLLVSGCATSRNVKYESVELNRSDQEIPAGELLDVGVVLFDPGLPEGDPDPNSLVFPEVRRAESRYMPVQLKATLEASGQWGSVWVLPEKSDSMDVLVWGRIDHSDGLDAECASAPGMPRAASGLTRPTRPGFRRRPIRVIGIRARTPIRTSTTRLPMTCWRCAVSSGRGTCRPFASVAELRFAADLVPAAFEGYLSKDRKGQYSDRAPAGG